MPSVSRQAFAPVSSPDQERNLPARPRSPVYDSPESVNMELDDPEEASEQSVIDDSQCSGWSNDRPVAAVPSSDMGSVADAQISYATRKGLPSSPVGHSRGHTLKLPDAHRRDRYAYPSSRSRRMESSRTASDMPSERPHRMQLPPSSRRTERSLSEKVVRGKTHPVERSRSTPTPYSSRARQKKGFWRSVGLWAKVVMSRFRNWGQASSPTSY
jgi:hypothetical protein